MRIIEKVTWTKEVTCTGAGNSGPGCGSKLEVERADLRFYHGSGYMERHEAVTFRCPCCGQLTDLPRNDWPVNPRNLAPFSAHWRDTGVD